MNQTVLPSQIKTKFDTWKLLVVTTGPQNVCQMTATLPPPNWFSITDFDFNSDDTMASADLEKMIKDNYLDIDHQGNPYNLRHVFGSHDDSDYEYNIPRQWYI